MEQRANRCALPAHYLGLILLSGSPILAGQAVFCVLVSDGLIPPLGEAGIQLILKLPFGSEDKHLLGFWLACGRPLSGEGWRQGKERQRRQEG